MRLLKLVPDNTNIDFMRWRNLALMLSILVTLAAIALVFTRGLNLGVDFVGGQSVRVTFVQAPNLDDLRNRVDGLGHGEANLQEFGSPNVVAIRMELPEGGEAAAAQAASQVRAVITERYPDARFDAVETVSGKVSEELFRSGSLAVLFAMIGIVTSVFTAVNVTRMFVALWVRRARPKELHI